MEFKAFFTDGGISLLDKRFLPAMQRLLAERYVTLLHRALRSALAFHSQSPVAGDAPAAIQVKLVDKLPARSLSAAPFLKFETKGARAAVVQDVPISRPLHAPML